MCTKCSALTTASQKHTHTTQLPICPAPTTYHLHPRTHSAKCWLAHPPLSGRLSLSDLSVAPANHNALEISIISRSFKLHSVCTGQIAVGGNALKCRPNALCEICSACHARRQIFNIKAFSHLPHRWLPYRLHLAWAQAQVFTPLTSFSCSSSSSAHSAVVPA